MKWRRTDGGYAAEHDKMRAFIGTSDLGYWWRVFESSTGYSQAASCESRSTQRKAKRECEALLKAMEAK